MTAALPRRAIAAYAVLGLPLAFAALPLYVHLPKLYGDTLGLPLASIGAVLLGTRLLDAVVDPILGALSDRAGRRRGAIALALPVLGLGLFGLLAPPPALVGLPWLALLLTAVSIAFSAASINYQAWGAELSSGIHERTRLTAAREGFGLAGVIAASLLPGVLGASLDVGSARTGLLFLPLLAVCAVVTLTYAPRRTVSPARPGRLSGSILAPLRNAAFRALLGTFLLNGTAAAIPATLVLFYVGDVLRLASSAGVFLALYFISGALALPFWVGLSRRFGKMRTWAGSMVLGVAVFVWAFFLGTGDLWPFAAICALSGAALGADLALPPSLLADAIDRDTRAPDEASGGAYFGLWNLAVKLNLALAAGVSLPMLALLGYAPGASGNEGHLALSAVYALLPVGLKLIALASAKRAMRIFR